MSYILSKLKSKFESKDPSLPIVMTDIDGWIDERLISAIEKDGWKVFVLDSLDDEFFVMIEAEKLKKQGAKVIVDTKKIPPKNFVHLAEYYDRGNKVDLYAKNIAHELGVATQEHKTEKIVDILRLGLFKDEKWWRKISQRGIDVVLEELEDRVWDLIKDASLWDEISETERELIITEYFPRKFGLEIRKDLKPIEIANRLSEKIFQSYFLDEPSEELKKFYEKWEDSKEMEKSFLEHSKSFEDTHFDDLIKNMDRIVSRTTHPFFRVEKKFFTKKVDEFLETKNREIVEFARSRSKMRDGVEDSENGIHWDEFAQLDIIFEKKDLSEINSLDGIIKTYQDFVWKFDRLDRILETSHLPLELVRWARGEIEKTLREANSVWLNFYDPKRYEITDQNGLIRKILEQDGKQAVIVADAFRYELAASINIENSAISKNIDAIMAMTPTITPIGMGALFSSGNVKKEQRGKNFFIVDCETGKKISDVRSREENIKRLVDEVKIYSLGNMPRKSGEKLILISREVDEAGHGELLKFVSKEILEEVRKTVKELVGKGYTVHIVSDHGFCLLRDENKVLEEKDDSFHPSGRYKLLNKKPENLEYEKVSESYIGYAGYNNNFEGKGTFYHGGISIQEVLVPHVTFKAKKDTTKVPVSIVKNDNLGILRKKRAIVNVASNGLLEGNPRRVYVEVKKERFDSKKAIGKDEIIEIPIFFEASSGEKFRIDLYDADDGTHLDSVEVTYLPLREELF